METLAALHADSVRWRVRARVGVAAGTLTRRALGVRFEAALFGRVFASIVAARLFTVLSVTTVALFADLDDPITAQ